MWGQNSRGGLQKKKSKRGFLTVIWEGAWGGQVFGMGSARAHPPPPAPKLLGPENDHFQKKIGQVGLNWGPEPTPALGGVPAAGRHPTAQCTPLQDWKPGSISENISVVYFLGPLKAGEKQAAQIDCEEMPLHQTQLEEWVAHLLAVLALSLPPHGALLGLGSGHHLSPQVCEAGSCCIKFLHCPQSKVACNSLRKPPCSHDCFGKPSHFAFKRCKGS